MTLIGVERQSKARHGSSPTSVDVATLQADYDRLWLHVRVIYVVLVVLTACYVATTFTVFSASRQFFCTSPPTAAAPQSRVSWRQNLSAPGFDGGGVTETDKQTADDSLLVRRRRRASYRRHRLPADDEDDNKDKDKLASSVSPNGPRLACI